MRRKVAVGRWRLVMVSALSIFWVGLSVVGTNEARAFSVLTAIPTGARPQTIATNPVTHKTYVAHDVSLPSASFATVIDDTTNTVAKVIPVGLSARNLAVNPATNRIYVTNFDSDTILVINGAGVIATVGSTGGPTSVAVDSTTNTFYAGTAEGGDTQDTSTATTERPMRRCPAQPYLLAQSREWQ